VSGHQNVYVRYVWKNGLNFSDLNFTLFLEAVFKYTGIPTLQIPRRLELWVLRTNPARVHGGSFEKKKGTLPKCQLPSFILASRFSLDSASWLFFISGSPEKDDLSATKTNSN
jgi:hypothetical protein